MVTTDLATPSKGGWFTFLELAWFITTLATGLAMAAALTHALELPNKIVMNQTNYFAAQQSYRGWNQLAFLLSIEVTGMVALVISRRRVRPIMWRVAAALIAVALAQAIFWSFTFPANLATQSWTTAPKNWDQLRTQWEYSHLGGAAFQLLAFSFLVLALLRRPSLARRDASC
jgi:hypothetical protein